MKNQPMPKVPTVMKIGAAVKAQTKRVEAAKKQVPGKPSKKGK